MPPLLFLLSICGLLSASSKRSRWLKCTIGQSDAVSCCQNIITSSTVLRSVSAGSPVTASMIYFNPVHFKPKKPDWPSGNFPNYSRLANPGRFWIFMLTEALFHTSLTRLSYVWLPFCKGYGAQAKNNADAIYAWLLPFEVYDSASSKCLCGGVWVGGEGSSGHFCSALQKRTVCRVNHSSETWCFACGSDVQSYFLHMLLSSFGSYSGFGICMRQFLLSLRR